MHISILGTQRSSVVKKKDSFWLRDLYFFFFLNSGAPFSWNTSEPPLALMSLTAPSRKSCHIWVNQLLGRNTILSIRFRRNYPWGYLITKTPVWCNEQCLQQPCYPKYNGPFHGTRSCNYIKNMLMASHQEQVSRSNPAGASVMDSRYLCCGCSGGILGVVLENPEAWMHCLSLQVILSG